jgi:hypothetical protein
VNTDFSRGFKRGACISGITVLLGCLSWAAGDWWWNHER